MAKNQLEINQAKNGSHPPPLGEIKNAHSLSNAFNRLKITDLISLKVDLVIFFREGQGEAGPLEDLLQRLKVPPPIRSYNRGDPCIQLLLWGLDFYPLWPEAG